MNQKGILFVKNESKRSHCHEKMNQKGLIFVKNDSKRSHLLEKNELKTSHLQ